MTRLMLRWKEATATFQGTLWKLEVNNLPRFSRISIVLVPVVHVTNYRTCIDLKQHECILLQLGG